MATVVPTTIGSGLNYSSPQTWDDAVVSLYSNDLDANSVIWQGKMRMNAGDYQSYAISSMFGLSTMVVGGSTVSASAYKHLTAFDDEAFFEVTDLDNEPLDGFVPGAGMKGTGSGGAYVHWSEAYGLTENLVFTKGVTGQSFSCFKLSGQNARARNMIFYSANASIPTAYNVEIGSGSGGQAIINSLIINNSDNTSEIGLSCTVSGATPCYLLGSTMVRPPEKSGGIAFRFGAGVAGGDLIVTGCAIFGFGTYSTGTNGSKDASSDYNATDLASGFTNTNDINSISGWGTPGVVFVDPRHSTADYRLAAGSALIGASTRIQIPAGDFPANADTDGPAQYEGTGDVDIALRARSTSTPSIGAFEYVTAVTADGESSLNSDSGLVISGGGLRVRIGPFEDENGDPVTDISSLCWWFFDVDKPGTAATPTAYGTAGTIDGSGYFDVSVLGTTLVRDDVGYLVIGDTSGQGDLLWKGWQGPVVVL